MPRTTKQTSVVNVSVPYEYRSAFAPPRQLKPGEPPYEVQGRYTGSGNTWMRDVTESVSIEYSTVDEAIKELRRASAGLTDARLDIDTYEEYGSTITRTTVSGKRAATPEEVVWVKKQIATDKAQREKADSEEMTRLQARLAELTAAKKSP